MKKKFSQYFLKNKVIINKIINIFKPKKKDIIFEIGSGNGILTEKLLNIVKKIYAIEIDKNLFFFLKKKYFKYKNFFIYLKNILKFNFKKKYKKIRIIGNLPYNISTLILFKLLKFSKYIKNQYIMLQKEYVDRIMSKPKNKNFGRLSIILQINYKIKKLILIKSNCFFPKPKINSLFIKMIPRNNIKYNKFLLNKILKKIFSKKRKFIYNSLEKKICKHELINLKISPLFRPEDISIKKYLNLINFIEKTYKKFINLKYKFL